MQIQDVPVWVGDGCHKADRRLERFHHDGVTGGTNLGDQEVHYLPAAGAGSHSDGADHPVQSNIQADLTDFPLLVRLSSGELRHTSYGGKVEATVTRFETKQENLNSSLVAEVRDELAPLLARPFTNLVDYRDRTSSGWEFQVLANLTRNWTLLAGYSVNQTEFTRFFPLLNAALTEARATARARGLDPDGATTLTRAYLDEQEDAVSLTKRATGSLTTRYSFTEGRLKGFTAGASARYARGRDRAGVTIAGVQVHAEWWCRSSSPLRSVR